MGLGLLRRGIGFESEECPENSDDFQIQASFDVAEYKRNVKEMFELHRKYTINHDNPADVETEDEMIRQSCADLCDILTKSEAPSKMKKNDKKESQSKISKVKLRILLEKHSLKQLKQYVLTFVKLIQHSVSYQ